MIDPQTCQPINPAPGLNPNPDPDTKPKVVFWYKLYCGLMTFIYFALFAFGVIIAVFPDIMDKTDRSETLVIGIVYAVIGFILFIAFGLSFFLPRRFWAWVVHLVLICIGMTSCCCLPVTVPLLIFWINIKTRSYFKNTDK